MGDGADLAREAEVDALCVRMFGGEDGFDSYADGDEGVMARQEDLHAAEFILRGGYQEPNAMMFESERLFRPETATDCHVQEVGLDAVAATLVSRYREAYQQILEGSVEGHERLLMAASGRIDLAAIYLVARWMDEKGEEVGKPAAALKGGATTQLGTKKKTCRACGTEGLVWGLVDARWLLHDMAGTLHDCPTKPI